VSGPGEARRGGLLALAAHMTTGGPRTAHFANQHGARELLLRGLEGAVRRGDEELTDAISAAVAEESRCADTEATVELMAVGGSQVGAAAQRPPGVERVHLRGCGRTLHVHESPWADAGLAWRIWGASRIMAHALDATAAASAASRWSTDASSAVQGQSRMAAETAVREGATTVTHTAI